MFNPCVIFQWSLSFWSLGEKRTKKKRAISQKKPFLLTEWPSCSTCCHRNRHVLNYELFLQNPSCWDLPNCYFETVLLNDFSPEVIQFILILWTPCQPYHGCCFVCCHLKPAIETHWKKKNQGLDRLHAHTQEKDISSVLSTQLLFFSVLKPGFGFNVFFQVLF